MSTATTERSMTEHEAAQVERANATNATPVVFVHGLWLRPRAGTIGWGCSRRPAPFDRAAATLGLDRLAQLLVDRANVRRAGGRVVADGGQPEQVAWQLRTVRVKDEVRRMPSAPPNSRYRRRLRARARSPAAVWPARQTTRGTCTACSCAIHDDGPGAHATKWAKVAPGSHGHARRDETRRDADSISPPAVGPRLSA